MMSKPTLRAMPASTAKGMSEAQGAATKMTSIKIMALTIPERAERPPA
jgi:hypothetical protein